MSTHTNAQETTFFNELQRSTSLDLRDQRGKRHNLGLVLVGLLLGLLRGRDGNLSSIHRSMVNTHDRLCSILNIDNQTVVSRAQFPRILQKVNLEVFQNLLFKHYQIELSEKEQQWFAGDGKEIKGSIDKGKRRGEASVQIVSHQDRACIGQSFYNGDKESEKPCLHRLVEKCGMLNQKLTFDALHLHPKMTININQASGIFIIGLKGNQKLLLENLIEYTKVFDPIAEYQTLDKGHGRIDEREYASFDISEEYYDDRWKGSGFSLLIRVSRTRKDLKNSVLSKEISYYISNNKIKKSLECFQAIRNHWSVEVNNHYRDVSFKEDKLKTKKSPLLG